LRYIGGYRDVVAVFLNSFVIYELREMFDIITFGKRLEDFGAVFIAQLVLVAASDKFG